MEWNEGIAELRRMDGLLVEVAVGELGGAGAQLASFTGKLNLGAPEFSGTENERFDVAVGETGKVTLDRCFARGIGDGLMGLRFEQASGYLEFVHLTPYLGALEGCDANEDAGSELDWDSAVKAVRDLEGKSIWVRVGELGGTEVVGFVGELKVSDISDPGAENETVEIRIGESNWVGIEREIFDGAERYANGVRIKQAGLCVVLADLNGGPDTWEL